MPRGQSSSVCPTAIHSRDRLPTLAISEGSKAVHRPLLVAVLPARPPYVPTLRRVGMDRFPCLLQFAVPFAHGNAAMVS